jgi:uncharacterized protein YdaU (DUF1376 family)
MTMIKHSPSTGCAQAVDTNFSTKIAVGAGHNSAPYGEQLREHLERLLGEEADRLFIYAQWHIGDYIIGTQGMSLEHEGAYQRFLMRLYARGKPLPDDDRAMAAIMSLSTRVWCRVKAALVALGKIIVRAGCLTNGRFEKERLKRAEQLHKRSLAAQARWRQEREVSAKPESAAEAVSPKFEGSLPETSAKFSAKKDDKPNEIKAPQDASAYANQYPLTKSNTTLYRARAREELDALRKRLLEAGGSAINEAHPGFLVLAEPIAWLEAGCDLEMDIVPAIQKTIRGKRAGQIVNWAYFRAAVREARDIRLTPMPARPSSWEASLGTQPQHWREREAERSKQISADVRQIFSAVAQQHAGAV